MLDALVAWQRYERDRTEAHAAAGIWPWHDIMSRPGEHERFDDDIAWLARAYERLRAAVASG